MNDVTGSTVTGANGGSVSESVTAVPWNTMTVVPVTVTPLKSGTSSAAWGGLKPSPANDSGIAAPVLL